MNRYRFIPFALHSTWCNSMHIKSEIIHIGVTIIYYYLIYKIILHKEKSLRTIVVKIQHRTSLSRIGTRFLFILSQIEIRNSIFFYFKSRFTASFLLLFIQWKIKIVNCWNRTCCSQLKLWTRISSEIVNQLHKWIIFFFRFVRIYFIFLFFFRVFTSALSISKIEDM